ncbi:MAG: hypothetical protein NC124_21370 [Clostridium sp.]|nr:hypothetical protein [Clostridium sp.]
MNNNIINLPNHNVSISLIMNSVERCSVQKASLSELVSYTGKSEAYVKSAITAASVLGMIVISDDFYYCSDECNNDLDESATDDLKMQVFRKWLQKWDPYMLFVKYLSYGDSSADAVRKLCSFYNFNIKQKAVETLFSNWGKGSGIIDGNGKVVSAPLAFFDVNGLKQLKEEVSSDFNIRLYLINALTEKAYKWLNIDEIDELVTSILKYKNEPRIAMECAGRAYEDFLRRICLEVNLDAQKKNGISQVANHLYSSRDDLGNNISYIHSKQYNISQGLGDIRNMAGHSKEAKTMERWELSGIGALAMILTVITNIKSIYYYVLDGEYKF